MKREASPAASPTTASPTTASVVVWLALFGVGVVTPVIGALAVLLIGFFSAGQEGGTPPGWAGMTALLSVGSLWLIAALGTAFWVCRKIVRPIEALSAAARSLQRGEAPSPPTSSVYEFQAVAHALAVAHDRLRQAEQDHTEAAERYRANEAATREALEVAGAGTWRLDFATGQTVWDRNALRLLGLPPDTVPATDMIKEVMDPADAARYQEFLTHLAFGVASTFESRIRWPDNRAHWIRSLGGVTSGRDAGPRIAQGIIIDIDEIKLREAELLERDERLRELLATLDLGASMVRDFKGTIRFWSQGCTRLYGWRSDEAVGRDAHELLRTVFPIPLTEIETCLLRDGGWQGDLRQQTRDGNVLTIVAHKALRLGADGEPLAVVESLADVTHQRDVEGRLAQSQKMEAVGLLTGGIAHDFNNLLLAIGLTLESVEQDVGTTSPLAPIIQGGLHATDQARTLISQLLAFGRRQSLNPGNFDVNDAVAESVHLLRRTVQAAITIETKLGPGVLTAFADRNQFGTALLNLVINARDAMTEGGTLMIETSNTFLVTDWVENLDIQPGEYIAVSLTDTGSGMSPEVQRRAFEPFFTTKPTGEGTGLGLSQVYGFSKQSGGHVRLQSERGKGTTVTLYLPRGSERADLRDAALPTLEKSNGERILMVEDNTVVRQAVARALRRLGYVVVETVTGDAALDILRSDDDVDLLFTDMMLPGRLIGSRLVLEGRQLRPGLRVLLTSGYSQSLVEGGLADLEGVELIAKPYKVTELAECIHALLARKPSGKQRRGIAVG